MKTWKCPICGEETSGSYSEGGVHMGICVDCCKKQYERFSNYIYKIKREESHEKKNTNNIND